MDVYMYMYVCMKMICSYSIWYSKYYFYFLRIQMIWKYCHVLSTRWVRQLY